MATTQPFTATGDVATGFGLAGLVALTTYTSLRRRPAQIDGDPAIPLGEAPLNESPRQSGDRSQGIRACWPWLVVLVALVAVELFAYFSGGSGRRSTFPTISSLYDSAARVTAVKALVVFVWLSLGWSALRP